MSHTGEPDIWSKPASGRKAWWDTATTAERQWVDT